MFENRENQRDKLFTNIYYYTVKKKLLFLQKYIVKLNATLQ